MDKLPITKQTYTFSSEEIEKFDNEYKKNAKEIVDNDDTLTIYESADGSYWTCRKCQIPFECAEHSAHFCPNCGRKIYNFIKENKAK